MTIREFEHYQPEIDSTAFIDPTALVIGNVRIGADTSVWPMATIRGDVNRIEIGARTSVQDGAILHATHDGVYTPGGTPLVVGDKVTVGHGAILHACIVEEECLIGIGSVVLDKAVVQKHVMLGAGSLVSGGKVLEGGYLWVGRPAKRMRKLSDKEMEYLRYSAEHYVKLKNRHQNSQQNKKK